MSLTYHEVATPVTELQQPLNLARSAGSLAAFSELEVFEPGALELNGKALGHMGIDQELPPRAELINAFNPEEQEFALDVASRGLVRALVVAPIVKPHGGLQGGFEGLAAYYNRNSSYRRDEVKIVGGANRSSWYQSPVSYNNGTEGSLRVSLLLDDDPSNSFREKTAVEQWQTFLDAKDEVPGEVRLVGVTPVDYLVMHAIERHIGGHFARDSARAARILSAIRPEAMSADTQAVTTTPDGQIIFDSRIGWSRDTSVTAHRAIEAVI